jgi:hypothetical protein
MTEVQGIVVVQRSLVAEAAIAFGAPVSQGTTGAGYAREATASTGFAGVAIPDPTKDAYAQYDMVKLAKIGLVPVILAKTAAVGTAEANVEGQAIEVSATAGAFIKAASGVTVARLAEDGSFLSTETAATEKIVLATLGV